MRFRSGVIGVSWEGARLPVLNRVEPMNGAFARRVLIVLGLVTLFMGAGWLIAASPGVPLLLFASVLGAIGLSSMADPLNRHLSIPRSVCVIMLALGLVVALSQSMRCCPESFTTSGPQTSATAQPTVLCSVIGGTQVHRPATTRRSARPRALSRLPQLPINSSRAADGRT